MTNSAEREGKRRTVLKCMRTWANNKSMKVEFFFLIGLGLSLAGCCTNRYEKFYVDLAHGSTARGQKDAPVILKTPTTEDEVVAMIENGYEPIGLSAFSGLYTPFSLAVDTAEKHGADLVLLDIKYKTTETYTSIVYLPSYSTTSTYGTASATAYGGNGSMATVYGSYFGSSSTTTTNPMQVQRSVEIYTHDAMFYRKVDVEGRYGVVWYIPKRLPDESVDAPIKVRIMAVFRGSQADKDGVKHGQFVKKINGVEIRTRNDMRPFFDDRNVKTLEVVNAK